MQFAPCPNASESAYDVVCVPNVMLPLRDGVRLATDLYFPARGVDRVAGELPAIVIRTPYDRTGSRGTGEFYARRGYVFASQDVRGRFASEGDFYGFKNEGPDGYDTVEWLASQPWCNGKVGTLGSSYCGAVQSALAALNPPHLSAMVVQFGPSSYYHSAMRHNGALELRFLVYAFGMAASSKEARANPALAKAFNDASQHVWDYLREGPIRKGTTPLQLLPIYEQWALDLQEHVCYDEHWRAPGWGGRPYYDERADVPTLFVGGWYDTYTRSTCENFVGLHGRQENPVHMLIGPWTHSAVGVPEAGDLTFAPDGGVRYEADVRLPWFDQWLKGMDQGLDAAPPVRYFLMGRNPSLPESGSKIPFGQGWRDAHSWPPAGTSLRPFFFHADGALCASEPSEPHASTTYVYDPAKPVPTIGGNLSAMPLPAGGFDQKGDARFPGGTVGLPLSARADVLSFQTELLTDDIEIAGPVQVRLFVSSTAPDTDFTAKLVAVLPPSPGYPAGAAINLTDSICRLRFRDGYETEELGVPGTVYELVFDLYPTACRFMAGQRIRVDISSSNYPRFDTNPNTGGDLARERCRRTAENTLHHSSQYPSHILLPVQGA
jgi:putative CocE/NonD family hydrolase